MKKILILIWSVLTFMLLSGSISWAQRVQVFEDWEAWNKGGCYIATKGTNGDFLYRSFGEGKGIEFTIYDKKQIFKPDAEFFILIDEKSEVAFHSHPNPKTPRERSYLWSHPKDDSRLDKLFEKGVTVEFNSRRSKNSVFSLAGYPDAADLMDNNCVVRKLKVLQG